MRIVGFTFLLGTVLLLSNWTQRSQKLDRITLGKQLFMDSILSEDYTLSCASCHRPYHAFADTSAVSTGVHGRKGTRNTPSAMNMTMRSSFFWDGRAATLEQQALMPIENPVEMNLPIDSAIARLRRHTYYSQAFVEVFGEQPTRENLGLALAEFERTLETSSAYDRYMNGDTNAISASAKRGLTLFNEKAKCIECHFAADLTGDEFRNIGLYDNRKYKDVGRYSETKDSSDLGKFKVPSLRNVAVTAPYMHDGSFRTLAEVIDYYNTPNKFVKRAVNRDTLLNQPLRLTKQEMRDLEAFLHALTAPQYVKSK